MTDPMAALPTPGERRLAVRVTPAALRHLRAGHPWIYDRSITSTSHDGRPGDLAVVFDDRRDFAGIGLWDPGSPIRVRLLHHGAPTPIDAGFWADRISRARARRAVLAADPATDAYRLVHGENDGLPGLVIDNYAEIAVLKIYTAAWLPHLPALVRALPPGPLVVRLARAVAAGETHGLHDGAMLAGPPVPGSVPFRENGLRFTCSPTRGHKTGHFLDQRENRARVRELASEARVLDVFSCTGGFTVHAAEGGAASVHSIDVSRPAVAAVERHLALNRLRLPHRATVADAFAAMDALVDERARFEMVVVDPPSFAPRHDRVDVALAAYRRLTRRAVELLEPGGMLVQASCSARIDDTTFAHTVERAAASAGATLHHVERTGHPSDHPIGFRQGAYLKAVFARVDR